ncbi:MAG: adenylate kinase, partial [Deltaproteobacteria bacterium CG_4_10_14_3_um_filter_51_14]
DQDEKAIDQRHSIYYDTGKGTMAGSNYFKQLSKKAGGLPKVLEIDGRPGVKEVAADLTAKLKG